jgi:hypothetical protein
LNENGKLLSCKCLLLQLIAELSFAMRFISSVHEFLI